MGKSIYKQMYVLYNVLINRGDFMEKVLKGYKFRMYPNYDQKN